jgi:hypothetical protein
MAEGINEPMLPTSTGAAAAKTTAAKTTEATGRTTATASTKASASAT